VSCPAAWSKGAARAELLAAGFSPNVAGLVLEGASAINSGHLRALEPRSARNTTPTSFEAFVAEEFVPLLTDRSD
jgi:hypothetical protein